MTGTPTRAAVARPLVAATAAVVIGVALIAAALYELDLTTGGDAA